MSQQYNRIFMTLKNDSVGYGFGGRMPTGRCIIETRGEQGKISLLIQDLKPNILYKGYVIDGSDNGSRGFPIGTITVDAKGKAELKVEIDCTNICKSGLPIERINTIAVLVAGSSEAGIVSPLIGFRLEAVRWKNRFVDLSKPPTPALMPEPMPNLTPAPTPPPTEPPKLFEQIKAHTSKTVHEETVCEAVTDETVYKAVAEESDFLVMEEYFQDEAFNDVDNAVSGDIHETFKSMAQKFNQELEDLEYYTFLDHAEKSEAKRTAQKIKQPEKTIQAIQDEIGYVFENNLAMTPFKTQSKPVSWVRISLKELAVLPLDCWGYMNHPFILVAFKRYNHLILGRYMEDETQAYYIGVPAQYENTTKQSANMLGFHQFKCCDDMQSFDGAYGYWLMKIFV